MSYPRLATLTAGLLAAASLAACSSVGSSSPAADRSTDTGTSAGNVTEGGTLTMALSAEPDFLDPTLAGSFYSRYVFNAMCEKLYDVNADTEVVPQLAASMPKVSNGGKTVTIKVRQGVTFADGTDLDAAAVKTSLERDLDNPQSARVTELGPITSIDAPDASTVVIHLRSAFAPLTAALADRAGMVMSPTQLDKLGDKFGNDPVCVGPFKFSQRVPQNSITLVKDPNYYDADKVHLDKIVYRIITDSAIRAANLKSGDVQVADTVGTDDVSSIQSDSSLQLLESPSLGYQGVTFNVGNVNGVGKPPASIDAPYAQDPRIRQAFEDAIDRDALVKTVFDGQFDTACGPISPQSQFSTPAVQQCRSYDPDKAKQLLQAAGVPTPYKLSMLVTNTPDTLKLAQALQAMVKPAGFDLKLQPLEFTTLLDQQDQGKFQVLQLGWSGRVDPDANITNFIGTQGSQNVGGYSSPKVDSLLAKARQTQDISARAKIYGQVQAQTEKDNPIIYLYRQRNLTGVSKDISGVQVFPDGIIRVAFAGYTQ
jgi:peptide/nickel transport system substrate-binding protein